MEFPRLQELDRVIIAMKGLPSTGKSEIATLIGEWARCPVFSIDDFMSTVTMCLEKGYSSELMPSEEEAERLHRLAFDALCKAAHRCIDHRYFIGRTTVVTIKSRLCSTFELDCLLQLSRGIDVSGVTIIIIECYTKNEHRLCDRLEFKASRIALHKKEWYKPRSRHDFEKARDDWHNSSQPDHWDPHLCNLINSTTDELHRPRVIRLVLDPFDDLNVNMKVIFYLTLAFRDAISYLLSAREEDWIGEVIIRDRYEVVQFHKLRRYLVEKELLRASNSGQKSKYLCPTARDGKCCVFKTCAEQELLHQVVGRGDDHDYNCGLCDKRVVSAGYACHFCILTLHKSCAEHQSVNFLDITTNAMLQYYPLGCDKYLPRGEYACKSCTEEGKDFSVKCISCLFQTHLKCGMFSTIIQHDCHQEHFLSLQVIEPLRTLCKACEYHIDSGCYGCYVCGLYYCLRCVLRPGKLEHNHGGDGHVMKLVYSRDGVELEEDYWCSLCYGNMDPQHWFYSCQDCPCYEAHLKCITPVKRS